MWDVFISRLKRPWSSFSPFLFPSYYHSFFNCVVSIVFGGCNQSFSVLFYVVFEPLYRCDNVAFIAGNPLPPSFFIHIVCQHHLCDVMLYTYMVISFLVLWSIRLCFSLVHFKMGPEYLTMGTAQVFITLIRFLLKSFVSSSFLVLLGYSFWIFPFIFTCLMVSASKMLKYLKVSFSPSVLILSWFGSSIQSVLCRFPLFIPSIAHFSMPDSIRTSWLYNLTACFQFFLQIVWCHPCTLSDWFFFLGSLRTLDAV